MKTLNTWTLRTAALIVCSAGLAMSSAAAQQDAPPPPPQDGPMQGQAPVRGGGHGDRRIEMLQSQLQLSPDQTSQMKAIFMDQRAKMDALRANSSLAPKEMHQQMMAIHQDAEAKVHAILTPDQATKYDAMEAKMRQRGAQRGMGGPPPPPVGAGSPPPPPPPQ